ncbi:hypothetical protein TrCOL_g4225 [Triparma columacea]|nr:hypothetical protein TrCOL_g4225 [Triparma columacea]
MSVWPRDAFERSFPPRELAAQYNVVRRRINAIPAEQPLLLDDSLWFLDLKISLKTNENSTAAVDTGFYEYIIDSGTAGCSLPEPVMNELQVRSQEVLGEEFTKKCFYPDRSDFNALVFKCPSAEDMSKLSLTVSGEVFTDLELNISEIRPAFTIPGSSLFGTYDGLCLCVMVEASGDNILGAPAMRGLGPILFFKEGPRTSTYENYVTKGKSEFVETYAGNVGFQVRTPK